MKTLIISDSEWQAGIEKLNQNYRLFAPKTEKQTLSVRELKSGELPDVTDAQTRFSFKSIVFPQSQPLFSFDTGSKNTENPLRELKGDSTPSAVLGIRPCDAFAFKVSEKNFANEDYPDSYWVDAYNNLTLVGLACDTPNATCFCTSTDSGPYNETGLDILLSQDGDGYKARILTQKGEELVRITKWTRNAESDDFADRKEFAENKISTTVATEQLKKISQTDLFNASFWDDIAFSCLNCGTCSYVCPTCWCFDIEDEQKGTTGIRRRNWDSCMFPVFTLEGSGHNPRSTKTQRVRQRFMHKLKYYVDKYNEGIQCVGCGRCVKACPVNIDIRSVCETMNAFQPVV